MTADPKIVRRATELAVQHEDCPDCIARAGELCYSQGYGHAVVRDLAKTHMARFAGLGSPQEYVDRMSQP